MSEQNSGQVLVVSRDFDDIERELLCSDREAALGVFLGSDQPSPQAMANLARPRPWSQGGRPRPRAG